MLAAKVKYCNVVETRKKFCSKPDEILLIMMLFCCFSCRYWLGPREDKNDPPSKQELGSLRLRVCHTQDYVFPSRFYDPLRETILGIKDGQVQKLVAGLFKDNFNNKQTKTTTNTALQPE